LSEGRVSDINAQLRVDYYIVGGRGVWLAVATVGWIGCSGPQAKQGGMMVSGGGSSELKMLREWCEGMVRLLDDKAENLSRRVSALEAKCGKKEPAKAKKKGGK